MNSTRYDTIYVPGFKREKLNAWPEDVWYEDDEGEANAERHYLRLPSPAQNERSLTGNAIIRCLEATGHLI